MWKSRALLPWQAPSDRARPAEDILTPNSVLQDNLSPDHAPNSLFHGERPPLPIPLPTGQRAQLADVMAFVHEHLQGLIQESQEPDSVSDGVCWSPGRNGKTSSSCKKHLARYLHEIANPEER